MAVSEGLHATSPRLETTPAALAAYGLATTTWPLPEGPLPVAAWSRLVDGAVRHRLQGQLAAAVRNGDLRTTARQHSHATALHEHAMLQMLRLERLLVETATTLAAAGIDFRVLKGPAVARLAYDSPSSRVFGDIDLLVPSDAFDEAIELVMASGLRRRQAALSRTFDRTFGKGVTLVTTDGLELDVHRTFAMGPFGLVIDLPAAHAASSTIEIGGLELRTLDVEWLLLHACFAAALGDDPPRLVSLRDVAELVLGGRVDPCRFLDVAGASGAWSVAALGIAHAWRTLRLEGSPPLVTWSSSYQPSTSEARWLEAYGTGSYGALARASLGVIDGLPMRASFLRSVLAPSRGFLDGRCEGRATWLLRGVRRMIDETAKP